MVCFYKRNVWVESKLPKMELNGTWITYYESGKEWTKGSYINNEEKW